MNPNSSAPKLKIGVFDSGIGGLSIVNAIKAALPEYEVLFRQDEAHFPYGTKTPGQIVRFADPILQDMVHEGCAVIVVACNTTATTTIHLLRQLSAVPLIGVLPMIEDAVNVTRSGKIAICATPTVYSSQEYRRLKANFKDTTIFEVEIRDWPYMSAHDIVDDQKVGARIEEVIGYGADTIVLAATHYAWIGDKIQYVASRNNATVITPEETTVAWLKDVLKSLEKPVA